MNKNKVVTKENTLGKHVNNLHITVSLSDFDIKKLKRALEVIQHYKNTALEEFNKQRKCPIDDSSWHMIKYSITKNKLHIEITDGMIN
jgi:tRNA A37 N6-isopentenylltransferase MiaA